ncbi:MAG: putative transposase [Betaproteobacteria bacterium]|jgi:transposase|nr:putative transposase [Betaproteobacteria bacterium]
MCVNGCACGTFDFGMRALPAVDIEKLPRDVDALLGVIADLHSQYSTILDSLQLSLAKLRRMHFGASSERLAAQGELFSDTVSVPLAADELQSISYQRPKSKGRPRLPADLPRTRIEYDLTDEEKSQFERLTQIGEEVSETLEFTPAKLTVIEHARAKYRCENDGESTIRVAAAEPSPIAKSNASAGLLAQVLVSKYADGLPLNRQERIFRRHGVELSRATLCDWIMGSTELLSLLRDLLKEHVLAAPVIFSDDTALDLILGGRGQARTARMWAYVSAGHTQDAQDCWHDYPRAACFEFTETRAALHPTRFLADYSGYLQADDYAGYHATFRSGRVIHVACWAHSRRRFHDIVKTQSTPGLAQEALRFIAKLYEIEGRGRDLSPDKRLKMRQAETVPLLSALKRWLEEHYPQLLPKGPLAQAFGYVLSNWQALHRFTENGSLAPDTNLVERTLRPIAIGRKAWLFAGSMRGGHAAAIAFSLIETCKLNRVEPFAYLKDVLGRINAHRVDRLHELLPFNWKPAHA